MSKVCEHPFCTRSISTTCSNHCQLDLCQEHTIEHKALFLVQYEKSFNKATESLNEIINSIEETKKNLNNNYQKDIFLVNENHNNKLNELEQEFQFVIATQKLIKQKLQLLNDVKNDQTLLYQYEIEQIKLYLTKIHEYHQDTIAKENNKNDMETSSSFNSDTNADVNYSHKLNTNIKSNNVKHFYGQCPLTRLGIYGLTNKHKLRLCSSNRKTSDICLIKHFNRYHHLKWTLSSTLTKAIINKLDPLTTCIFQSGFDIIDQRFHRIRCPLNKIKSYNCRSLIFIGSLKKHLLKVHHFKLKTYNKINEAIKRKISLMKIDFDEDEFKFNDKNQFM
ncbi:unnamed protein product [Rotaria sordida]|uniref:Uncharacterized protein n=1 Tax=Rotaria sordida TaxID=392033 RepID=A0A814HIF9_9BILA|nr:unnamed protein product [Rotaria sordida]CAF4102789.1 unnamed protein product [Rotaria sordida]